MSLSLVVTKRVQVPGVLYQPYGRLLPIDMPLWLYAIMHASAHIVVHPYTARGDVMHEYVPSTTSY